MSPRSLLSRLLSLVLPLAITSTVYLYLYPIFHGCTFGLPDPNHHALLHTLRSHLTRPLSPIPPAATAPFRLLILADPQLEGDTSLPSPDDALLPRLQHHWTTIKASLESTTSPDSPLNASSLLANLTTALHTVAAKDLPRLLRGTQKRLDLLGNDFYLAHIYRTLHWWTRPTHVTVLGDLVGSQWIGEGEFEWRGRRFWERVFRGGERVGDDITATGTSTGEGDGEGKGVIPDEAWNRRIINIAGNHDIGYAGDVSAARIERFERVFGRANWDIRFEYLGLNTSTPHPHPPPTLHLVNLNSLTLDTPALDTEIQSATYAYLNDVISRSHPVQDRNSFTLLLTHVPLHKSAGICTDGPQAEFHESDDEDGPDGVPRFRGGGLREQNHLSEHVSANGVLQGIFGLTGNQEADGGGWGRNGLILTGHDHTGCDVVHFVDRTRDRPEDENGHGEGEGDGKDEDGPEESWKWNARRYHPHQEKESTPSIREVTLRSMMGEFGGNAGLLSLWFDPDPAVNEWRYEISMCKAGVQHIWWAVHVLDILAFGLLVVYLVSGSKTKPVGPREKSVGRETGKGKTAKS